MALMNFKLRSSNFEDETPFCGLELRTSKFKLRRGNDVLRARSGGERLRRAIPV